MAGRWPAQWLLTAALRRLGRRRPELFERLGPARRAAFVIAPTDFPVSFRLRPDGAQGKVWVTRHGDPTTSEARISGPLLTLVNLFDGGADADSAFFSRQIRIEGDTEAVVALHNTLEASGLSVTELLGVPSAFHAPIDAGLARLRALGLLHPGGF